MMMWCITSVQGLCVSLSIEGLIPSVLCGITEGPKHLRGIGVSASVFELTTETELLKKPCGVQFSVCSFQKKRVFHTVYCHLKTEDLKFAELQ